MGGMCSNSVDSGQSSLLPQATGVRFETMEKVQSRTYGSWTYGSLGTCLELHSTTAWSPGCLFCRHRTSTCVCTIESDIRKSPLSLLSEGVGSPEQKSHYQPCLPCYKLGIVLGVLSLQQLSLLFSGVLCLPCCGSDRWLSISSTHGSQHNSRSVTFDASFLQFTLTSLVGLGKAAADVLPLQILSYRTQF